MKIEDLEEHSTVDSIRARILSMQGPKRRKTRKGMAYVTDILIVDETGTTVLNLRGREKVNSLKIGQVIEVKNADCTLQKYQKQISLGPNGSVAAVFDDDTLPKHIPR